MYLFTAYSSKPNVRVFKSKRLRWLSSRIYSRSFSLSPPKSDFINIQSRSSAHCDVLHAEGALPVSSNVYGHGGCRQFCIRRMQLLSSDDEVNVIAPGGTFNDLDRNPQSLQEQQQQQQQQKSTLSLFYIAFIKHGRATVIDYHLYSMATQSRISFKFPSCLCCQRRVCTRWSNRSHTGKKATKKLIVKRIQGSCLHMPFECLILKE